MADVVCVGLSVLDIVGYPIDHHPASGMNVVFDNIKMLPGGCAQNAAIALGKMGLESSIITKLGSDNFADFLLGQMNNAGVNTAHVKKDANVPTSFTFVMVSSSGERSFYHLKGANKTLSLDDIDMEFVKQHKIVLVEGTNLMDSFDGAPAAQFLKECKEAGLITIMDSAYNDQLDDWWSVIGDALPYLDYFVPSYDEAKMFAKRDDYKEIARAFLDGGCGTAIIKLGGEGVYVLNEMVDQLVPSYKVNAIDTTGAGDVWGAGFAAGLVKGLGVVDSALFANAASAHCVQQIGCTTGIKSYEEMRRFQEEYKASENTSTHSS